MSRSNNLDLLRLIAALDVAIMHGHYVGRLWGRTGYAVELFLKYFPAVPIFFLISGFLVSQAWVRSVSTQAFFKRRILRIFPGLWVCQILSIAIIVGIFVDVRAWRQIDFVRWLVAQIICLPLPLPRALVAIGPINAPLWTISVECCFYALTPLLMVGAQRLGQRLGDIFLLSVCVLSALANALDGTLAAKTLAGKALHASFLPHLFIYVLGILFARHWHRLQPVLHRLWPLALLVYGAAVYVSAHFTGRGVVTTLVQVVCLACLTFMAGLGVPALSIPWLRNHDLSYGMYLYHSPIQRLFYLSHTVGSPWCLLMAVFCAAACAVLSWRFVEAPALQFSAVGSLKNSSSQPLGHRLAKPCRDSKVA